MIRRRARTAVNSRSMSETTQPRHDATMEPLDQATDGVRGSAAGRLILDRSFRWNLGKTGAGAISTT